MEYSCRSFSGIFCVFLIVFLYMCFVYLHSHSLAYSENKNLNYSSEENFNFKLIGQVGGPIQNVIVKGKYAYTAIGFRLVILDVSKPQKIKQVGATPVLGGATTGLYLDRNLAYVTAGCAGLYIVDVKKPRNPQVIGSYDSIGYAENVIKQGKYTYVADGWAGLVIIDVSNPTKPSYLASISKVGNCFDLEYEDNTVYLAAGGSGLQIVDVRIAECPVLIGTYDTPGYTYNLSLSHIKKTVYLADGWKGARIIDVSCPSHPKPVTKWKTPGWTFDVCCQQDAVYVADGFKGLRAYDFSSPPKELGACEFDGHSGKVFVDGDRAFVADSMYGLRIISLAKKELFEQIGIYSSLGDARRISVKRDNVYVAGRSYGFRVLDISQPAKAKEIGKFLNNADAVALALDGRYVYLVSNAIHLEQSESGLHIIDIANPKKPRKVGYYPGVGGFWDAEVRNDTAYITDEYGMLLVDVSNPWHPNKAGYIDITKGIDDVTIGVEISGKYAYVAKSFEGIAIVDISNPKKLALKGSFKNENSFSHDIIFAGNMGFVPDYHGLRIWDMKNPVSPVELGFSPLHGDAVRAYESDGIIYVANGGAGICALDVSNPSNPVLIAEYDTPGFAGDIVVVNNRIYVADGKTGVLIFEKEAVQGNISRRSYAHPPYQKINSSLRPFNSNSKRNLWELINLSFEVEDEKPTSALHDYNSGGRSLVVNKQSDSGKGSLRWCIENAQPGDTITFSKKIFPPKKPRKIHLVNPLPVLTQGKVTIDASGAGVILDGEKLPEDRNFSNGLCIKSSGNVIKGLQILHFPSSGIAIISGEKNQIGGNRRKGRGPAGEGNIISYNRYDGILIQSDKNKVFGNLIGLDATGKQKWGNGDTGVRIFSAENIVGSQQPGYGNIIGNNGTIGVGMVFKGARGNQIVGNFVGTDITGNRDFGNLNNGISIEGGSFNNLVEKNLVCGSSRGGIVVWDTHGWYNTIIGNTVGISVDEIKAFGNDWTGVAIGNDYNRIGGTGKEEKNIFSGNSASSGLSISGDNNVVLGNLVGTDSRGFNALGNHTGIALEGGKHNHIGGMTEKERNIISGNEYGFSINGSEYNFICGNTIGMKANGTSPLYNTNLSIQIKKNTYHNFFCNNLISGFTGADVYGGCNVFSGNIFKEAHMPLWLHSDGNFVYQNKFLKNTYPARNDGMNLWDWNGAGNYYSDYQGVDADGDGIGDTPYYINQDGVDHFPLMNPLSELRLGVAPEGSGEITVIPEKGSYEYGEIVKLTAVPETGYDFSFWSGDIEAAQSRKNPAILKMTTNKEVTGNFTASTMSFLMVSKDQLNFVAVHKGDKTPDQFISVHTGRQKIAWLIEDNVDWLFCSPKSGVGDSTVAVGIDHSGLPAGTYRGQISIFSPQINLFRSIVVFLEVISGEDVGIPFGEWDSPSDAQCSRSGCIQLYGWALDKIGIENVKIYREKSVLDDASGWSEIFIGQAYFVEGGRPDIEAAYPLYPYCGRAGWGYNLASEMLPGNEIYTFVIKARSFSGTEVELGKRKIMIDNTMSSSPYGVLDFPKPEEWVPNELFQVIGWATIQEQNRGADVDLYIDSVYHKTMETGLIHPDFKSQKRKFLNSKLSGLAASVKPEGLSGGWHSLFLKVEDSVGRISVIKSIPFFVSVCEKRASEEGRWMQIMDAMGVNKYGLYGRFAEKKQHVNVTATGERKIQIRSNELKHIALKDFCGEEKNIKYEALYRASRLLPLGMSFNQKKGIISWLPIPGFKGEFPIEVLKYRNNSFVGKKIIVFSIE